MQSRGGRRTIAATLAVLCWMRTAAPAVGQGCIGDCNGDGRVTAGELTRTIALMVDCGGLAAGCAAVPAGCANADGNGDGVITVDEILQMVANILNVPNGCPVPISTTTSTPSVTASLTPSATAQQPAPTATPSQTPSRTETAMPFATSTPAPTNTPTPLPPTATASAAPSLSVSTTPTPSLTNTPAVPATDTPSPAPTNTLLPSPTPTPFIPTATATATATATPGTVCGNGVIESGETCTTCPADCTVHTCTATTPIHTIKVNLTVPVDQTVSGLTLLVGYKSGTVSLPGSGAASTVGSRIKNKPSNTIFAFNDLDYALRTVLSRSSGFSPGQLYTVDFDSCQGAAAVTVDDFACTVEGCSNTFGTVTGCSCAVSF